MRKIILLCVLAIGMMADAQTVQTIAKPLKLNIVAPGTAADSVLVRGADKIVKFVPRSEFGGGASGVTSLFGVTDTIANNNRIFDVNNKNFSLDNAKSFNVLGTPVTTFINANADTFFYHDSGFFTDWIFAESQQKLLVPSVGEKKIVKLLIDGIENNVDFLSKKISTPNGDMILYAHAPITATSVSCLGFYETKYESVVKIDTKTGPMNLNSIAYFEGNELKKSNTPLSLQSITSINSNTNNNIRFNDLLNPKYHSEINYNSLVTWRDSDGSELEQIIRIQADGIHSTTNLPGGTFNNIFLSFQNDLPGVSTQFNFPNKPGGTFILATSDDVKLKEYTVSTLPIGTKGDVAYVYDASSPAFLATVVGGGSSVVRVFYNGTNWIVQ